MQPCLFGPEKSALMRSIEFRDYRRRVFWWRTCEAAGTCHPLVNVVVLGSIGVCVVEHGTGQRGAVVLRHCSHARPHGRWVRRLLGQRRVDPIHHRQRGAHAARRRPRRGLIGRGGAADAARPGVGGADSSQGGRWVLLRGVRRACTAGVARALGSGQGWREDAGEGFGLAYDGGAVATADRCAHGAAGGGHAGGVGWRVRARRHWAHTPHRTARQCCCHRWDLQDSKKTL